MEMAISFTYLHQVLDKFASNVCDFCQMVRLEDFSICWAINAGWIDGNVM